jgi:hypothetical protein
MKKIVGYIAVLFVFSWVTTANAGPIAASIANLSGSLKIDGFGDSDPSTLNILFENDGTVSVFQNITRGKSYNVTLDGTNTYLGSFNANFNIVSPSDFDRTGSASIGAILDRLFPSSFSVSGSPLGSLTIRGNTLDLLSVTVGVPPANTILKLVTQVTRGTVLNELLNNLDKNGDGSLTAEFTNAHLDVTQVPEPTALLLLCTGLVGIFSFSTKRA